MRPAAPPSAMPVRPPRDPALWAILLLTAALWLPTLRYGYALDDLWILKTSLAEPGEMLRLLHTRLLWAASYAVLPADAWVQRLASLALAYAILALLWRACARHGLDGWQRLFALGALLHPAFIFAVTWIAQRCDLLLILFVLLALGARNRRTRLLWVALASAAKAPFVLQNLVFAADDLRARRWRLAAAATVLAALALLGSWATYHALSLERDTLSAAQGGFGALLAARAGKVAEGAAYIVAPVPAFWDGPATAAAAALAYGAAWAVLAWRRRKDRPGDAALWVGLAMLPPFAFASDVRIAAPAATFLFLGWAPRLGRDAASRAAIAGIVLLNLTGSALNARLTDTAVATLDAAEAPFRPVPLVRWDEARQRLRAVFREGLGIVPAPAKDSAAPGISPSP